MNQQRTPAQDTEMDQLCAVMAREIPVMRELLASLDEEQHALLTNTPAVLKQILKEREEIVHQVTIYRTTRLKLMKTLQLDEKTMGEESCELGSLRDQMLALLQKMKDRNASNSYLLQNKICLTREMLSRLYPKDKNATYNPGGLMNKPKKSRGVTVLSREV